LNLLRFKEGGRSSYDEYARAVVPFLAKVGGEVVYAGDGSTALQEAVLQATGWGGAKPHPEVQ
jgi:hypothetical protein